MKTPDKHKPQPDTAAGKNSQTGFTLIELLIAMVIFIIVTGAIYGLLEVGRVDRNRSSRRTDVMKNARAAVHLIGRDVLNAGLSYHKKGSVVPDNFVANTLGLPADADTTRDLISAVIPGNNVFANNLLEDPTHRTDTIAFAFRDIEFNNTEPIQISGVGAGSAANVARLTTRLSTGAANVRIFDMFLVESNSTQALVMATAITSTNRIDFAPTAPLGINQPYNGTGENSSVLRACSSTITDNCTTYSSTDELGNVTLATLKKVNWISYKVKSDGTLVRTIYGNNTGRPASEQIQEQPLAYNVRNLKFRYLLEDGRVMDNPTAGADGIAGTNDDKPGDANLITQITVTLEVISTELDEATGKPQVITLKATFSTRNIQYDAG